MKELEALIKSQLNDPSVFFVFPTDIAASAWLDYSLSFKGGAALPLERFVAWDSFKAASIRSAHQDKKSIPVPLRKLFVEQLLERNKTMPFFFSLISPEYRSSATSFTDWISCLLPRLSYWKQKRLAGSSYRDAEDKDLFLLESEYSNFLDQNQLFDPAWERPPFNDTGKTYYIVYPETLRDFAEYKELFLSSKNVRFVHAVPTSQNTAKSSIEEAVSISQGFLYSNTRSELRQTALFIRHLCAPKSEGGLGLNWTDIAVSVADIESIEPYVLREFNLHNIPFQLRAGKKLGKYPSGRLFSLIQTCADENFSFNSVRNLILNPLFPWKDSIAAGQLISFGVKHNCLRSYDNKDIWEEAFKKTTGEERAHRLYAKLRSHVLALNAANSFAKIRTHYFAFKDDFFASDSFSTEANLILSRSIAELDNLIDLEKTYPQAAISKNPFAFFIKQLESKDYLAQSSNAGVNIFPYTLAAAAPFEQHIILNSSQKSLSIINSDFDFLSAKKRQELDFADVNMSDEFIGLYVNHSAQKARFTASEKTFSGYSILHHSLCLTESSGENENYAVSVKAGGLDGFSAETTLYKTASLGLPKAIHAVLPRSIYSVQKEGFKHWSAFSPLTANSLESKRPFSSASLLKTDGGFFSDLKNKIDFFVRIKETGKIRVSAASLKSFYTCPLQWLFSKIFKIEKYSLQASLMDEVYLGTLYHEIIKRVLIELKAANTSFGLKEGKLHPHIQKHLEVCTWDTLRDLPESCGFDKDLSQLNIDMFRNQAKTHIQKLTDFFTGFFNWFEGSRILSVEEELIYSALDWELHGKLDCVLDYPGNDESEAGVYIVDFKIGKPPSTKTCLVRPLEIKQAEQNIQDFQLAAYILLYENQYFENRPWVQGAGFFSIYKAAPASIIGILKSALGNSVNPYYKIDRLARTGENAMGLSFVPTMDNLFSAIEDFAAALNDPDLKLFTDPNFWGCLPSGKKVLYTRCNSCSFKSLCRTTYSISGEQS